MWPCKPFAVSFLLLLCVAGAGLAAETPLAVSPGDASRLVLVESRCPTFNWGAVDGASSYELVVYRLGGEAEEAEPALSQRIAGSALGWTPSLDRCLERGARYAWAVRSSGLKGVSAWSEARLFEVTAGPSASEVRQALATLNAYLAAGGAEENRSLPAPANSEATEGGEPAASPPAWSGPASLATLAGVAAIRGNQGDSTGDTLGVVGEVSSADGAGVAAANLAGGADLLLDGSADLATDTILTQAGIDRASTGLESFDIGNSLGGGMTLTIGGLAAVTTATDNDTLGLLSCADGQVAEWNAAAGEWHCSASGETYTAGDGLLLTSNEFSVEFGTNGTATSTSRSDHDHAGQSWSGTDSYVLKVQNTTTGDFVRYGLWGLSEAQEGVGVLGSATDTVGANAGVQGVSSSPNGYGVFGVNTATTFNGTGVFGWGQSPSGQGVVGFASDTSGSTRGVHGLTWSTNGRGVYGEATATSGLNYGVYGETSSPEGFAGYFLGRAYVSSQLGIGTTSPARPLSIAAPQAVAQLESSTNTFGSVLELKSIVASPTLLGAINFNTATATPGQIAYEGDDEMTFKTNNAERMRITSTGDVTNDLELNGLVKAWAQIKSDGTVLSCWRCNTDPTMTRKTAVGEYLVFFDPLGIDISARPVLCSSKISNGNAICSTAAFSFISVDTREVEFGSLQDSPFTVLVF